MPDADYLLAGVGGGLRGLIEAYKTKMQNDLEQAKTRQGGFDKVDPLATAKLELEQERADSMAKYQTGMLSWMGGDPDAQDLQANAVRNGFLDPKDVPPGYRGMNAVRVMTKVLGKGPIDVNALRAKAAAERFTGGPTAQRIERSATALGPLIDDLKNQIGYDPATGGLTGKTVLSNYPVLNKLKAWGAGQIGSDAYTGINANVAAIQKELNLMAANGGSDKNLALAIEMIKPGASPAQILKGLQAIERMAGGRAKAYTGVNPFEQSGGGDADTDPMGLFK